MAFLIIFFVSPLAHLLLGYALGLAWLSAGNHKAYTSNKTCAPSAATPAGGTDAAAPSSNVANPPGPEQVVGEPPEEVGAAALAQFVKLVDVYAQRFDRLQSQLEAPAEPRQIVGASSVIQATIDYWLVDQSAAAEPLLECWARAQKPDGPSASERFEEALLQQQAQSETSLANLRGVDGDGDQQRRSLSLELENLSRSFALLTDELANIAASA